MRCFDSSFLNGTLPSPQVADPSDGSGLADGAVAVAFWVQELAHLLRALAQLDLGSPPWPAKSGDPLLWRLLGGPALGQKDRGHLPFLG